VSPAPRKPPAPPKRAKPCVQARPAHVARDMVDRFDELLRLSIKLKLLTAMEANILCDQIALKFKRATTCEELFERAARPRRAKPATPSALGGMTKRARNEL
jgi:hypothetical protein